MEKHAYSNDRRDRERREAGFDAVLVGGYGNVPVRGVNASRTGVLLEIVDRRFAAPPGVDPLVHLYRSIQRHFEGGAHLSSPDLDDPLRVFAVRVADSVDEGHLVGFRFEAELPDALWSKLMRKVSSQ